MNSLGFRNYLIAGSVTADSSYTLGAPFSDDRYLYGVVPAGRSLYTLKGDMPDPPYFLADYFTRYLKNGDQSYREPTNFRLLNEKQQASNVKE